MSNTTRPRSDESLSPKGFLLPKLTMRLAVLRDGKVVSEHEFASRSRRLVRIGRQPGVHVALEDNGVARCHAVIEMWDGCATLIDLGHTGGCLLNDGRIRKAKLASHDRITIGNSELTVVLEQPEADERPNTRTRLFFQQLRITPQEWIPDLHRFLEYMTFTRRPGEPPNKVIPPPVVGRPRRLSLTEALPGLDGGAVLSRAEPRVGEVATVPEPAVVAAMLADAGAGADAPSEGSPPRHDFYDTRRLVHQLKRERRRIHWGAVVGVVVLAIGALTFVSLSGDETSTAATAVARTQSASGVPVLPPDDASFAYRRVAEGQTLSALGEAPWAPAGYDALLAEHNPSIASDAPLVAGTVVKLPRQVIYQVARGDTLGLIAERVLGDRGRADAIHDANRELIPDPSLIEVGMELRVPVAVPAFAAPPRARGQGVSS